MIERITNTRKKRNKKCKPLESHRQAVSGRACIEEAKAGSHRLRRRRRFHFVSERTQTKLSVTSNITPTFSPDPLHTLIIATVSYYYHSLTSRIISYS